MGAVEVLRAASCSRVLAPIESVKSSITSAFHDVPVLELAANWNVVTGSFFDKEPTTGFAVMKF